MHTRLLALDADGTLLDPSGQLPPAVLRAVSAARDRGLAIVICTGRRFRTVRPLLDAMGLPGPVVIHNGVLVKSAASAQTLLDSCLPDDLYRRASEIMRGVAPPLVYVDQYHDGVDLFSEPTDQCHEYQAEYVSDNREVIREVPSLDRPPSRSVITLSAMADTDTLIPLANRIEDRLGDEIQTNLIANKRYRGHILEVVVGGVSKWSALLDVAATMGITGAEIAAIGDDNNDLEMIRNAGLGIAMSNAIPAVREAADYITTSNAEAGAAVAIERILAGELEPDRP